MHVFFEKDHLSFSVRRKSYFREKQMRSFLMIEERLYSIAIFFGKTIFSEHLKSISYFYVFFWERSSFIFRLKSKIIFPGKRNIIFPDGTRKIIFQCIFFGKTIFSEHLKIENMVFRAVLYEYYTLYTTYLIGQKNVGQKRQNFSQVTKILSDENFVRK